MEVKIINPDTVRDIYRRHGEFACVCYDTPPRFAERVGKSCASNGHMSGSRCEYIKFRITGIDRGTAEQIMRHEIGVSVPYAYQDNYSPAVTNVSPDQLVKNMASFRYIDKNSFEWEIPNAIRNDATACMLYDELMIHINDVRERIKNVLVNNGCSQSAAIEAANFTLPRATKSSLVIGFTPEALIHFCHKRLCSRAQEFVREVACSMRREIALYAPEFAEDLVPQCEYLLWCPEGKRCCGRAPTREEAASKL